MASAWDFWNSQRFRHRINPTVQDLCTQIPEVAWSTPADVVCHCTGSHPGSFQRAPAFCTGGTAPTSTCSITRSLGQGFGVGDFSGLVKLYFLWSSDKFFPQVQAQGETCSSELALLIAKSGGVRVPSKAGGCRVHFSEAESLSGATLQSRHESSEYLSAVCNLLHFPCSCRNVNKVL